MASMIIMEQELTEMNGTSKECKERGCLGQVKFYLVKLSLAPKTKQDSLEEEGVGKNKCLEEETAVGFFTVAIIGQ